MLFSFHFCRLSGRHLAAVDLTMQGFQDVDCCPLLSLDYEINCAPINRPRQALRVVLQLVRVTIALPVR
jgi:hypothetical protein